MSGFGTKPPPVTHDQVLKGIDYKMEMDLPNNTRPDRRSSRRLTLPFKIGVLLVIVVPIFGWSAWKYVQFFQPNMRTYYKGAVEAVAHPLNTEASYTHLKIGSRGFEYAGVPEFDVRLSDGSVLNFPEVNLADIIRLAYRSREAIEFVETHPSSIDYLLSGCKVVLADDRVIQVRLYGFADAPLGQIKTARSKTWRSMPLSDGDLLDLFGEPDELVDEWRH